MNIDNKRILTEKITGIIDALKGISNVGICFYDLEHFFYYDSFGIIDNKGHYCDFCKLTRVLDGKKACTISDRVEAPMLAKEYKRPFFHECHMGICECIVPIFYEDKLLGVVFVGQCRIKGENKEQIIRKRAKALGGNGDEFIKYYNALPEITRKELSDIAAIIYNYFDVLTETLSEDIMAELGESSSLSLSESICKYISSNYMHDISLNSISEKLFLNPSHVARTFKKETGGTVMTYINNIRCNRAADMLKNTNIPIKSIAANVGITDANYFARLFKKVKGISPEGYRKMNNE